MAVSTNVLSMSEYRARRRVAAFRVARRSDCGGSVSARDIDGGPVNRLAPVIMFPAGRTKRALTRQSARKRR